MTRHLPRYLYGYKNFLINTSLQRTANRYQLWMVSGLQRDNQSEL
ncbi:hypothetical protein [Lacticaseibacillus rhamnosus]|uniref:Uncharacterized protein n=1 Tax=Lacticaseibacillus rhamnosus LRHMDP3 TaxID=1203259 RepID=A0AB33XSB6_LACRH|nr:hypothetical protein [Lacticaseibacillus rhamnosus]EKS49732.1 hypothetical protein LRHMDP3_2146 [Lacticaseibacillus rhamnosus LRHMDP3]EKS50443.1 hypothetical protein LRHMDP2_1986 [Lacticaseibacillus rhamnosus LRHMDP2]